VEGGGGGFTVSGVSRNREGFVNVSPFKKRLGISGLGVIKTTPFRKLVLLPSSDERRTKAQSVGPLVELVSNLVPKRCGFRNT
jgi:hypothetical protein